MHLWTHGLNVFKPVQYGLEMTRTRYSVMHRMLILTRNFNIRLNSYCLQIANYKWNWCWNNKSNAPFSSTAVLLYLMLRYLIWCWPRLLYLVTHTQTHKGYFRICSRPDLQPAKPTDRRQSCCAHMMPLRHWCCNSWLTQTHWNALEALKQTKDNTHDLIIVFVFSCWT